MIRAAVLRVALLALLLVVGCSDADKVPEQQDTVDTAPPDAQDEDGDGYYSDEDCDDGNPQTHPGAVEICDSVDNNCDGSVDEGVERTYYLDGDGDGFGDDASVVSACSAPEGAVAVGNDCDDADGSAFPGGIEQCDGVDNDCDGETDEDSTSVWYVDDDGDGFGDPEQRLEACEPPEGYVADDTDCDDGTAAANPEADELCDGLDNDCDGELDEDASFDVSTFYQDRDEDGFGDASRTAEACAAPEGFVEDATDCDDLASGTYPGADERCDDVDNDCDGSVDEDGVDGPDWYRDADEDGYGDAASSTSACDAPAGYVGDDDDCDDGDASVHPEGVETCDGVDQDCDGSADEGASDALPWYLDADEDGFGDATLVAYACDAPAGYLADDLDCDDGDPAVNPDAAEVCDGLDNDCDGSLDEDSAVDAVAWYQDRDEDGYGDASRRSLACEAPDGYTGDDTDCDDLDEAVYPGAPERCDGEDDDCDGTIDEEDAIDGLSWFADADGDGFGDGAEETLACEAPAGTVSDDTDCDDTDEDIFPGADETCDDIDNDCDGTVDENSAVDASTWYADADGDGFGNASRTRAACDAPLGYIADAEDCDDTDADIHPDADEVCDGADNDCDDAIDEDSASDAVSWYQDRDEDGYGDASRSTVSCSAPSGYVASGEDCDDLDPGANPGEVEICDDVDNDCDDSVDERSAVDASEWYADSDRDGYGDADSSVTACDAPSGYLADDTDCDDAASDVYPGAEETCDDRDEDCDGVIDASATDAPTWYADGDGDGYGDPARSTVICDAPSGYVSRASDCDDAASAINPDADEVCDDLDNDCDGLTDDASASDIGTWYADDDGDGYGDAASVSLACDAPAEHVADGTDCDDLDATSRPGGVEVCDEADNDCDGRVDDGAADASSWYADADDDGYGDDGVSATRACEAPAGSVADSTDCDDTCAACHPGATEICDDLDNDCDDAVDETGAFGTSTWYPDGDGDGYGDEGSAGLERCDAPTGYTDDASDCDDTDTDINPGETETCDGTDNDCSGDEAGVVTYTALSGTVTDVSSTWGAGTASAPTSITLSSIGTLAICPGTYYVSVTNSATSMALTGVYGSDETILSGGGSKRTLSTTRSLSVTGLTLEDGYTSSGNGGNISSTATLTLSDVILAGGDAARGGNLYLSGASATLDAVEILGGSATSGAGVYVTSGTLTGDTVFFEDNNASNGGGLYITGSTSSVSLTDSSIASGAATTSGGGVYLASSASLTLADSEIVMNSAGTSGGGVYLGSGTTLTMTGTEIGENSGGSYGGGAYLSAATLTMSEGSNIDGNTSSLLGGGLYLTGGARFSCSGSSSATAGVWGNSALLAGGAYMSTSDTITSTTCDWTGTTDNTLYDIVVLIYYYNKGNNATFTCDAAGC